MTRLFSFLIVTYDSNDGDIGNNLFSGFVPICYKTFVFSYHLFIFNINSQYSFMFIWLWPGQHCTYDIISNRSAKVTVVVGDGYCVLLGYS